MYNIFYLELMIAYLRSQLAVLNGENPNTGFFFQHTAPTYISSTNKEDNQAKLQANKVGEYSQINGLSKISVNQSAISSIP